MTAIADGPVLRIVSNMPRLGSAELPGWRVEHQYVDATRPFVAALRMVKAAPRGGTIVVHASASRLVAVCLLGCLLPWQQWHLISVDLYLTRPAGAIGRTVAWCKRLLLRRVDTFVVYFKDLSGYTRWYGVTEDRTRYVPFKVNSWRHIEDQPRTSDGHYVFTGGRSHRDLRTFCSAMRHVGYPGVILYYDDETMRRGGSAFDLRWVPPNVQAIRHDARADSWVKFMRGAKVVVLPTFPGIISAPCIGTYLDAMALEKGVVVSESPATRQLISDQALVVPAGDPISLADAIRRVWTDDGLRIKLAGRGRQYAAALGDESRLLHDILEVAGSMAHPASEQDGKTGSSLLSRRQPRIRS
jgi:glycosyltransferase involved in cell wall biosynthesis